MAITASQVKELREKTGVGMMDCKKALAESDGDMTVAVDYLRKKGLATAAKRAGRDTKAGLVALYKEGNVLSMFELLCETDFVAKNDDFIAMVNNLAKQVADKNPADLAELGAMDYDAEPGKKIDDMMAEAVAKIGESLKFGRFARVAPTADPGIVVDYLHTGGSIGVAVDFSAGKAETLASDAFNKTAHDIAMHVAAAAPQYLDEAAVPEDVISKEKEIYTEAARDSGKPEQILEKIATGKLNRFYQDNCLVKQTFVKDTEFTVESLLAKVSTDLGDEIGIKRFYRFKVGEIA
jgi:elongation factor Ts